MKEFKEAESTNNYLIEQLATARKRNEVLEAHIAELLTDIRIGANYTARKRNEVLEAHIAELLTDIRIGANYLTYVLRTANERI